MKYRNEVEDFFQTEILKQTRTYHNNSQQMFLYVTKWRFESAVNQSMIIYKKWSTTLASPLWTSIDKRSGHLIGLTKILSSFITLCVIFLHFYQPRGFSHVLILTLLWNIKKSKLISIVIITILELSWNINDTYIDKPYLIHQL